MGCKPLQPIPDRESKEQATQNNDSELTLHLRVYVDIPL